MSKSYAKMSHYSHYFRQDLDKCIAKRLAELPTAVFWDRVRWSLAQILHQQLGMMPFMERDLEVK